MPESWIAVMVMGIVAHWVFVPIVVVLAKRQGRDAFFWGIVAIILGPLALLVFYLWRGDRGAPGDTKFPLADPREDEHGRGGEDPQPERSPTTPPR